MQSRVPFNQRASYPPLRPETIKFALKPKPFSCALTTLNPKPSRKWGSDGRCLSCLRDKMTPDTAQN